jgi:endogenous inhibitor of DNA gyrase (YacG/DUF329 family)
VAWKNLRADLAEEFGSLDWLEKQEEVVWQKRNKRLESQRRRADPVAWAWEYAQARRRIRQRRLARAAARPPCPECGAKVVRVGRMGKLPKYCSNRCTRAAIWRRWAKKNPNYRRLRRAA